MSVHHSRILACVAGLLLAAALAAPASAKRVALVIGNAGYAHAPQLANPLNDANDIGTALDRLGFEVTKLEDADYDAMRRGLRAFTRASATSEIALVFYAGHGIEVDKRNFLIPIDARLLSDREVEFETVSLDLVSRAVEGASGLGLVILDACRDNPFAAAMKRSGASRSIGRGLAQVEPAGETLVAYAAKGGSVAADGEGRNSPYSTALLAHLEEPGLEVGLMFRKVRDAVLAATGRQQEPFVYGSLSSKGFYLSQPPAPGTSGPGGESKGIAKSDEQLFWESVKGSRDPADLEAYLEQFPEGTFAALARNRIKRLSDPLASTEDDPETMEAVLGLERTERQRIQTALWAGGFDPAGRDGLFDRKTREAIGKWQASRGQPSTGYLDVETAKTLLETAPDLSGGVWAMTANASCRLWNPGPQPGETVTWSGACEGGKASGEGRAVWTTARGEETYEGHYRAGRKHGQGTAVWPDGRRYEGQWRQGTQHGKGVRILPDGTRYEGEWNNGRMPDRGVIAWSHGQRRYEGEWQDGKPHGRGTKTWRHVGRYEGEWREGWRHGRGTFTWGDSNRYEGEWRNDTFRSGHAIRGWTKDRRYEGAWLDGKPHGQGIATSPDGDRYEGEWRNGSRHGRGTLTWKGTGKYAGREGRYEGEWKDDNKHGRGIYTFASGTRYEGEFRDDMFHGRGVYTWASGARHEGDFQNDDFHGHGIRIYANGNRYEGGWKDDNKHGRGIYTFASGSRYEGEWRNDKIHGPLVAFDKSGKKVAAGTATDGCFGVINGWWLASGKSAKECGFE